MQSETAQWETHNHRRFSRAFHVLFAVAFMVLGIAGAGHAQFPFSLTFKPNSVTGGSSTTAVFALSGPAPAGGALFTFTSSNQTVVPNPGPVTVPAKATSVTFPITTNPVSSNTDVTISLAGNGNFFAFLTVLAPRPVGLTFSTNPVIGGSSTTAALTLDGPAPAEGAVFNFTSGVPAVVPNPGTVTVPPKATEVDFPIATNPVSGSTILSISIKDNPQVFAFLTVLPPPPDLFKDVAKLDTTSLAFGSADLGNTVDKTFTVTAAHFANPSDTLAITSMTFTPTGSTLPADFIFVFPPSFVNIPFVIPSGGSAQFLVHFLPTTLGPKSANLVMTMAHNFSNGAVSQVTNVPTLEFSGTGTLPSLTALTVTPNPLTGGSTATGSFTLDRPNPPSGPTTVKFTSSAPAVVPVPADVTLAVGATGATFPVQTKPGPVVDTKVKLTATYGNGNGSSVTSTIVQVLVFKIALTFNPTSVTGGSSTMAVVTLSGPAPAGGAQVTFASDNAAVSSLGPVTVPAGQTASAPFPIATNPVGSVTKVTITASVAGSQTTGSFRVLPPVPISLTFNPNPVIGGNSTTGTVTLNGPAPSGALVALASTSSTTSQQAQVQVPAGARSASFNVDTQVVSTDQTGSITASFGGGRVTALLTLLAPPQPPLSSLTLTPSSVNGGDTVTGKVTLTGPATADAVVALSSNNPAVPTPTSVTVLKGSNSQSFTLSTTPVASPTTVTVTAQFNNSQMTATVTLQPTVTVGIQSIAASSAKVIGGDSVAFNVTLTNPAPSGGALVTFSSSNFSVVPKPADLQIPPGATTGRTLPVKTLRVTAAQSADITASSAGTSIKATLGVLPLPRTQIAVFHQSPSGGDAQWLILGDDGSSASALFGSTGDLPVPANYLGLGHAQIATYRPSTGQWHVRGDDGNDTPIQFGLSTDLPKPADYLGLGHAQAAVFRPAPTAADTAVWFVLDDTGTTRSVSFGLQDDIPVPGDYLGLGLAQFAVYRPSAGQWHILDGSGKDVPILFGQPNDIPAPADYLGTGRIQPAVYRPGTGELVIHPDDGTPDITAQLGVAFQATDVPVPGDYLGLGQAQMGEFRPATAEWFFRPLGGTGAAVPVPFGTPGDVPVAAAYLPGFVM